MVKSRNQDVGNVDLIKKYEIMKYMFSPSFINNYVLEDGPFCQNLPHIDLHDL